MRKGLRWLYGNSHWHRLPWAQNSLKDRDDLSVDDLVGLLIKIKLSRTVLQAETFAVLGRIHEPVDHDAIVAGRLVHRVDPVQV